MSMLPPIDDTPRQVVDPTTGRPILMAPRRHHRPMLTGAHATAWQCPFCPGQEHQTPPTLASCPAPLPGAAPTPWLARAFANKYPAGPHHEVIAEGDRHCEQPADLDVATWRAAIELWQRRIVAMEAMPGVRCAFLFKNVGALAGASIAHNHSQILGLDQPPPRLVLEAAQRSGLPHCPWCTTLTSAAAEGRLIASTAHHVVLAPEPAKLPWETWLLPKRCDDDFLATDAASLATALHLLFAAVAQELGRPAFNLWLHRLPGQPFHWHFELQPRTGHLAGLELGGDMYINSLPPVLAAERLRAAVPAVGAS